MAAVRADYLSIPDAWLGRVELSKKEYVSVGKLH